MNEVLLNVDQRQVSSKSKLASFRRSGQVPAVFYGKNINPKTISVDLKAFLTIIETKGENVLISLDFKDNKKAAIVKNIQRDIISQQPIHIDFQSVSLTDKVEVLVPIHIEGVSDGVKNFGGVMETIIREVKVLCLPTDIPQRVAIDVSPLAIGQGVTIADLPKLDGVEYLQDPSTLIVHIVTVAAEEEKPADAAAGAAAAEPEVISKGKKDKEGEEGEATAGAASSDKK